jgi:hypothetical protein
VAATTQRPCAVDIRRAGLGSWAAVSVMEQT